MLHFKHYKNINFENSYLIEILLKWNEEVSVEGLKVPTLLNEQKLDMGASFFKVII
jgi:hypothetical protein